MNSLYLKKCGRTQKSADASSAVVYPGLHSNAASRSKPHATPYLDPKPSPNTLKTEPHPPHLLEQSKTSIPPAFKTSPSPAPQRNKSRKTPISRVRQPRRTQVQQKEILEEVMSGRFKQDPPSSASSDSGGEDCIVPPMEEDESK
ncbi:uncharacterized protein LOC119589543 [Penaeus monodon]|uniref:uncharacterized protein LOC119589543 n=1 Tax=Penaeus monodon TaxID=6687 RepID=UPI0018A7D2C3|nr:uncharacterized protein LOC119589543 [Penaeus monodon]